MSPVLLTLLAGCVPTNVACTEVGCNGTLTIHIEGDLMEVPSISVDLGDFDAECGTGEACTIESTDTGATLTVLTPMGFAPETVTLTVEGEDHDVPVTWGEMTYPNGKDCDGADGGCASGEGELVL